MNDHDHDHDEEAPTEAELEAEAEKLVRKEIALSQIRQYGDAVLRMRAEEVESYDAELQKTTARMVDLMHDADGVGLAATQIGILRRFFVCTIDGEDRVFVNPVVTPLGSVRVQVERLARVRLEARDAAGEVVSLELEGYPARVVQHEVDHLDGTLMLERTDAESRREALGALRPRLVLS